MITIDPEHFTQALLAILDETFDNVQGFYLDRGNSLFETLAGISAVEASIPVGGNCATLAAQVKHTAFYLDVTVYSVTDPDYPEADWGAIWRTVSSVTEAEWQAIQSELRDSYVRIQSLIKEIPVWSGEGQNGGALAVIAHTAYHLGEIRQALSTPAVTALPTRTKTAIPSLTPSMPPPPTATLAPPFTPSPTQPSYPPP